MAGTRLSDSVERPAVEDGSVKQPSSDERSEETADLVSIGQVAARLGVSERTLRYYEEIGLLTPAAHEPGRIRRYDETDIARVSRIKELRDLLGFNLDEVRSILGNEDRLHELRNEYLSMPGTPRRAQLLEECLGLQEDLRAKVTSKVRRLEELGAELDGRISRTRALAGLPDGGRDRDGSEPAATG